LQANATFSLRTVNTKTLGTIPLGHRHQVIGKHPERTSCLCALEFSSVQRCRARLLDSQRHIGDEAFVVVTVGVDGQAVDARGPRLLEQFE
jgi:hypothetical protein